MLPIFLACSAGVLTGNAFWCWRLGYWDELGTGILEEKVSVIPWGWDQRGKGDHSKFPATELGMRRTGLDLRSTGRGVGLPSVYLPWEE